MSNARVIAVDRRGTVTDPPKTPLTWWTDHDAKGRHWTWILLDGDDLPHPYYDDEWEQVGAWNERWFSTEPTYNDGPSPTLPCAAKAENVRCPWQPNQVAERAPDTSWATTSPIRSKRAWRLP